MKINDIDIPEAEIKKLSQGLQKILYCLHWAKVIKTDDLCRVGGSGKAQRMRELNKWLAEYDLVIRGTPIKGEKQWEYFFQKVGDLPFKAPGTRKHKPIEASVTAPDSRLGAKVV